MVCVNINIFYSNTYCYRKNEYLIMEFVFILSFYTLLFLYLSSIGNKFFGEELTGEKLIEKQTKELQNGRLAMVCSYV